MLWVSPVGRESVGLAARSRPVTDRHGAMCSSTEDSVSLAASADPSTVFRELLARLEAEDWLGAVALHSPAFIQAEVSSLLRMARPARRLPTVESLLREDPKMPKEVAEYEADRARRAPPPSPYFGDLHGVESAAHLEVLSPEEIFARYLHGRDYRWRWRLHIDALIERHPEHAPALTELRAKEGSPWQGPVAGHIETDARAYVIYGVHHRPAEEHGIDPAPSVAVMRREDVGWRVSSDIVPGYAAVFGPVRVPDGSGGSLVLT